MILDLDDLLHNLAIYSTCWLASCSALAKLEKAWLHLANEHAQWLKDIFGAPESGLVKTTPTGLVATGLVL